MCLVVVADYKCVDCGNPVPNPDMNDPKWQYECPQGGEWEFEYQDRDALCGQCAQQRSVVQGQNYDQGQNYGQNQSYGQNQNHGHGQNQRRHRHRSNNGGRSNQGPGCCNH